MKSKLIYGLLVGAAITTGFSSCDNEKFLTVDHYSILDVKNGYDNDEHTLRSLDGLYDLFLTDDNYNGDPFKPYLFTGCHPSMDTQATGWDKNFMTQSWDANTTELQSGWNHAYAAISRSNDFLANIETYKANLSEGVRNTVEAEARCIRAFHYFWLATTFGRVPMLATGENYTTAPQKARAKDYAEMWDFIINDLKTASKLFGNTYKPYKEQYGRCTKGMAEAYLGDAYMWKAYRCPEQADTLYDNAKKVLLDVITCGEYELNDSYTTLWDAAGVWGKEAIFEQVLDEGTKWSSWDGNVMSGAHGWTIYYSAAPANGGWGTLALSWELYKAFESGDKRRDGSLVTAAVPTATLEADGIQPSTIKMQPEWAAANADEVKKIADSKNGYNPFVQERVNHASYKYDTGGEYAPAVYSTKLWRLGRCHWNDDQWAPAQIYRKRLANVYLDYAECCFRTNDPKTGWDYVKKIRERAFGKKEVGHSEALTSKYGAYYNNQMAPFYTGKNAGFGEYVVAKDYPIPFATAEVTVPDAETYYTQLKAEKGFNLDVWKIAVNEERRKEFSAEYCLVPDLLKSGYMEEHIRCNYPKHAQKADPLTDWQTVRNFDYDGRKMDMPIPADELIKNPLCDQNEAYRTKDDK